MAADQERIEVERIVNLVQGFGWMKVKEELTENEIQVVLAKKRRRETTPTTPS